LEFILRFLEEKIRIKKVEEKKKVKSFVGKRQSLLYGENSKYYNAFKI